MESNQKILNDDRINQSNSCVNIRCESVNNPDIAKNAFILINADSSGEKKSNNGRIRNRRSKSSNNLSVKSKIDMKTKLERSRQSARECRARKKLRYQYLEELVNKRECANLILKKEIEQLQDLAALIVSDSSITPDDIRKRLKAIG
ncbi:hypothetical protein NH340_JMT08758 [Sarcoptes scabiei]|nr:hypothetical protein NH340_JMT08758 [Sarcoptes scabiei]